MSRRETRNKEAFTSPIASITSQFVQSLATKDPYESIVDFATHSSFCGMRLYPRQKTLLKLIYLETEHFSAFDLDVIEEWRTHFTGGKDSIGIQPDIWERIDYLKSNGYRYFPHVQAVMGRRASKGLIGGILGAEKMAHLISLDNWQDHYQIAPGKDCYLNVIATNSIQAKKNQFADIRSTVRSCNYLKRFISTNNEYYVSLQSPADLRLLAEMQAQRIPVEHEVASIRCQAMSSVSSSGRGSVSVMNFYDEFAHMLVGTEGPRSSEQVYSAYQPSLDDFGKDSQTYMPSSPYCLAPETKVLTEDLRWVPVSTLQVGDKVIGFDENHGGAGKGRTYQSTVVTETSVIQAPRYELTMESGKKITCTGEHMWLSSWGSQKFRYDWVKTKDLKYGDRIKTLGVDPWETDNSRDGGYLAGFFDGEGYISQQGMMLGASQNYGHVQEKVIQLLEERGYDTREDGAEKISKFRLTGGLPETMRFLGSIRPGRLLNKFPDLLPGRRIYGRLDPAVDRVVSVERKDFGPVIALGTSTSTLIAEGLLSHNTKIGYFFDLYQAGCVLLPRYLESHVELDLERIHSARSNHDFDLRDDDIENEDDDIPLEADPEMLIVQLPSWELYRDFEKSHSLGGPVIKRAIQVYDERMKRLERRNPTKFKVEKKAQFAEVEDAYLNPDKVDLMFEPFWNGRVLHQAEYGTMTFVYEGHADPSTVNANFAVAIAHLEKSPTPEIRTHIAENGQQETTEYYWDHVVFDHLHVWKPSDYKDHTVDYVEVTEYLGRLIAKYPAMKEFTFDAWNSAGPIAQLRTLFPRTPRIRVEEFNQKNNTKRAEYFKSAINLEWIHTYRDTFFNDGQSLLEQELKFLVEKNGKIEKQSIGPVTTKDLADTVMEVSYRLLHHQLDQHEKALLGKMKMAKGMPGGQLDPLDSPAMSPQFLSSIYPGRGRGWTTGGPGTGRQRLEALRQRVHDDRRRRGVSGFKPRRGSW